MHQLENTAIECVNWNFIVLRRSLIFLVSSRNKAPTKAAKPQCAIVRETVKLGRNAAEKSTNNIALGINFTMVVPVDNFSFRATFRSFRYKLPAVTSAGGHTLQLLRNASRSN